MAFLDVLKEEISEVGTLMRRMKLLTDTTALGMNFRKYGADFGAYDFDGFVEMARDFYNEAIDSPDPDYTVVHMSGDRVAIDKNGERRGIFTSKGRPLAFFRPDYHQAGYSTQAEELAAFREQN